MKDINAKHDYGPIFGPIAQGLVHDRNATHTLGLRDPKRTDGSVSTSIAQGLVENMKLKGTKIVISPRIAQGLVGTHTIPKHVGLNLRPKAK